MARTLEFSPEEKIEKALNVFWDKGYTATSLLDLTQAMGLNKSSLYNSFRDKRSLFLECLKVYGLISGRDYGRAVKKKNKSPLELVDSIIDEIAKVTVNRKYSCFGVKTSFEMGSYDKEIQQVIKAADLATINMLISLITQAQSAGLISTARDAIIMGHFIFNDFAGWAQSFILFKDKKLVMGMAEELKKYLRF